MKVYKFYYIREDKELYGEKTLDNKYPLYAFTNNKEFRNSFREMRNMDKFIEIISKMSRDEYQRFSNSNRGHVLEAHEYDSIDRKTFKKAQYKIISTLFESNTVYDAMDGLLEIINPSFPPIGYTKKIRKALFALEYINIWSFKTGQTLIETIDGIELEDLSLDLYPDELGVLIEQIHETL